MSAENMTSVVVVGGGVEGWMSAAFLARILGPAVSISVLEQHGEPVFLGCATLPPIKAIHAMLGLSEADILKNSGGTMKLGTQFVNWGALGNRYFHAHGQYAPDFDLVPMYQWWLKSGGSGGAVASFDDLNIAWRLARENRFVHPDPDRRLIQSTHDYAYHLDLNLYADILKKQAIGLGVNVTFGDVAHVQLDGETGNVEAIVLRDGEALRADLYLDCSGTQASLAGAGLSMPFENWSAYLPCDRAIRLICAPTHDLEPYTRITQREAGWQCRTHLQKATDTGYVYASQFISDDEALNGLLDNLETPTLADPKMMSFVNGYRPAPFEKNVVAIGGAAGFLEPLEATGLHMVQTGLIRLMSVWPNRQIASPLRQQYNEIMAKEWAHARDLVVLHTRATSRTDSPMWRACQAMACPDSLQMRLALWQAGGRLPPPQPELFGQSSWLSVLIGQNVAVEGWDPLADARAERVNYEDRLSGIARVIAQTVPQFPNHRDWLDRLIKSVR